MNYWILLSVIAAVLYVWWRVMSFTFDLIERRHEMLRQAELRNAGVPLGSERGD